MKDEILLSIRKVNKSFSGVHVLKDIDLEVRKGEVHVLVGENGAGKSTLMKIISGVYEKDSGEIYFEGKPLVVNQAKDAQEAGISIIHQEFNLLGHRTVGQNIFLGREPKNKLGIIDERTIYAKSAELLKNLGLDIDPHVKIASLGIAQQQMVEVAKALSFDSKVLIMDEPTATLTSNEIENLFSMIHSLKEKGVSIIYISHRLEEFARIADRLTVLRDGHSIKTLDMADATVDEIIRLMVGREITDQYARDFNEPGEVMLKAEGLSSYRFSDVNFEVRAGEIVGFSGLVGAGRTEVAKAIFGDDPIEKGSVEILGKKYTKMNTKKAVALRMGLVPEDRRGEGAAIEMPLKNNVIHASLKKLFKSGILSKKVEDKVAAQYVDELSVATTSINKPVNLLSGGNQQKVVVAKWLCAECEVMIFDEPTRGIDVGAKAEIYAIMNRLAKEGKAIMMISSDMPELLGMCDRIYVMKDGKITAHFNRGEATQEKILAAAI